MVRLVDLVQLLLVELLRELHLLLGTIGVQLPVYFGLDVVALIEVLQLVQLDQGQVHSVYLFL